MVKMIVFFILSYRFNTIPIKISVDFFAEIKQLNLKIIQKFEGLRIAKTVFKKSKIQKHTLPDLKLTVKLK